MASDTAELTDFNVFDSGWNLTAECCENESSSLMILSQRNDRKLEIAENVRNAFSIGRDDRRDDRRDG